MKKQSNEHRERLQPLTNAKRGAQDVRESESATDEFSNESDVLSFWLLLLFVAVFFGIAAEEAQRSAFTSPFQSSTVGAAMNPARETTSPGDRKVRR